MAIDAHHCPGAVMFLFRGDFGWILYSGDFRWAATSKRAKIGRKMLLGALEDNEVDILYLDNTYFEKNAFLKVVAQQVVGIIASYPDHDVIIGIDSLGKDLLLHISRMLKIKIWVWPERLQIMHLLGFHETFTTKTNLTRARAVPRYSFGIETLEGLNTMRPPIGIMPSGLPWLGEPVKGDGNLCGSLLTSCYNKGKWSANDGASTDKLNWSVQNVERFHQYVFSVPYSDHSCFAETQKFIELVQPTSMKGIVSSSSCSAQPLHYFGCLCVDHQLSRRVFYKHGKEGSKILVTVQTTSYSGNCISVHAARKRSRGRVTRVRALRRVQSRAKI